MEWLKNKKIMLVGTIIVVILLCVGLWSCSGNQKNEEKPVAIENNKEVQEKKVEKVTDVEDDNEDEVNEEKEVEKEETSKKENEKDETTKKEDSKEEEIKKDINKDTSTKDEPQKETGASDKKDETKTEEKHTHDWKPIYTEVDNGHYEKVCVKEAWSEEVPTYTMICVVRCNGCGIVLNDNDHITTHQKSQLLQGKYECGGYTTRQEKTQNGTKTVEHPAEYEDVWVAKIEKVLTGYECSCGQKK